MLGFDSKKYLEVQSKHIKKRISEFDNKLYLEFGGKLFDDYHAARVLPGFEPDIKIKMLKQLSAEAEIIITISANDIIQNKLRADIGISYKSDVLRLIDTFRQQGLYVGSVVITKYKAESNVDIFKQRLESLGIKVYLHYPIAGYPTDVDLIVSDEGYGKNEYIETTRPLVVVTAPGPGSGKIATCLSQLYHEYKRGIKAGYAKFETFPIWNLPLNHPVNLAYEAATADLNDVNMIDPYHLEAYGKTAVNYNRDVEIFPVLRAIFNKILGKCPYASPTDMGVNQAGNCIIDNEVCIEASKQEIIRRYLYAKYENSISNCSEEIVYKIKLLLSESETSVDERKSVKAALEREKSDEQPTLAIELKDGKLITGGTTALLGASSAALLNALKYLANIKKDSLLISPKVIEPIQKLKVESFKSINPRLHTDEVLIALSISAVNDKNAALALQQLPKLKDCQAHSSVILSHVDLSVMNKLGINLTCEARYEKDNLYHK